VLVDPEVAFQRTKRFDRIEREGEDSTGAVDEAYRSLAEMFPERIIPVDGNRRPRASPRRSVDAFESFPEQAEAKRLLRAALAEGPAHAYLFHGPPGVGKRAAALAFAAQLIASRGACSAVRIPTCTCSSRSATRSASTTSASCARDLHMRPVRGHRRVYLVHAAETMNEDAGGRAAQGPGRATRRRGDRPRRDDLGPLPETIRSALPARPFTRLSERAVREEIAARAPGLEPREAPRLARLAAGRSTAHPPARSEGGEAARGAARGARSVYADPEFDARGRPPAHPRRRTRACGRREGSG
jgi:hypothetical protein